MFLHCILLCICVGYCVTMKSSFLSFCNNKLHFNVAFLGLKNCQSRIDIENFIKKHFQKQQQQMKLFFLRVNVD